MIWTIKLQTKFREGFHFHGALQQPFRLNQWGLGRADTLLWGWGTRYLLYPVTSRKSGTRIPQKIKPQRLHSSRPLTEAQKISHPSLIPLDPSGRGG